MNEYQITQYLDSMDDLEFVIRDFKKYGVEYKIRKDSKGRVALFTDYKKYETNKVEAVKVFNGANRICVGRGNE